MLTQYSSHFCFIEGELENGYLVVKVKTGTFHQKFERKTNRGPKTNYIYIYIYIYIQSESINPTRFVTS